MPRKRAEATLPALQASLILEVTRCMASVVLRPGLPPNCVGGRRWCFSVMKERSVVTSVENSLLMVVSRPIGRYALATLYDVLPGLHSTIVKEDSQLVGYALCSRIAWKRK